MLWVIFIISLIGLDQWSKWYIMTNKVTFGNLEVIKDFFYLTYLENRGAAFGMLQNFRWAFIVMTTVALVFMIWYFLKNKHVVLRFGLAFLIAGAVGNFIDRLFRGYVVDFFHFYPFGYDFAIFNVADVCVNVSVVFLLIYFLFIYKEPKKEAEPKEEVTDGQQND
jgi:signal peptidase II